MSITSGDGCLAYVFLIILWVRHEEAYGGFDCILKRFFFYLLLYHTCALFPCTIGRDAFSIQFD
jgi:hypothetical protein